MSSPLLGQLIEFLKQYHQYFNGIEHAPEDNDITNYIYGLNTDGSFDSNKIIADGNCSLETILYAQNKLKPDKEGRDTDVQAIRTLLKTICQQIAGKTTLDSIPLDRIDTTKDYLGDESIQLLCKEYKINALCFYVDNTDEADDDIAFIKYFNTGAKNMIFLVRLRNHFIPLKIQNFENQTNDIVKETLAALMEGSAVGDNDIHIPHIEIKEDDPYYTEYVCPLTIFETELQTHIAVTGKSSSETTSGETTSSETTSSKTTSGETTSSKSPGEVSSEANELKILAQLIGELGSKLLQLNITEIAGETMDSVLQELAKYIQETGLKLNNKPIPTENKESEVISDRVKDDIAKAAETSARQVSEGAKDAYTEAKLKYTQVTTLLEDAYKTGDQVLIQNLTVEHHKAKDVETVASIKLKIATANERIVLAQDSESITVKAATARIKAEEAKQVAHEATGTNEAIELEKVANELDQVATNLEKQDDQHPEAESKLETEGIHTTSQSISQKEVIDSTRNQVDTVVEENDFFYKMEDMFDDDTLSMLFIHDNLPSDFDTHFVKLLGDEAKPEEPATTAPAPVQDIVAINRVKIKRIFDYFRSERVLRGGGLSLKDFKIMIKRKILEIV